MSEAKKRNQIKISEAMFYNHLMRRNPVIHFVNNNDKTYYDKYIKGTIAVQVDGKEDYDKLDTVLMKEDTISVGIEQFLVDGTNQTRGSTNHRERGEFLKRYRLEKQYKDFDFSDTMIQTYEFSLEQYQQNFINKFEKHLIQMTKYRETLSRYAKNKGINITNGKIGFLIYDDYQVPITFSEKSKKVFFHALLVKELVQLIGDSPTLDFIMLYHCDSSNQGHIYFMLNSKNTINKLLKRNKFLDSKTGFSKPKLQHVIGSARDNFWIKDYTK